jgi:hypothetical protein
MNLTYLFTIPTLLLIFAPAFFVFISLIKVKLRNALISYFNIERVYEITEIHTPFNIKLPDSNQIIIKHTCYLKLLNKLFELNLLNLYYLSKNKESMRIACEGVNSIKFYGTSFK